MNHRYEEWLYYVDVLECGVLITTGTPNCPGKKIFPQDTTATFVCSNRVDATTVAHIVLTLQKGEDIQAGDALIFVESTDFSYKRCSEEYELKVE